MLLFNSKTTKNNNKTPLFVAKKVIYQLFQDAFNEKLDYHEMDQKNGCGLI